MLSLAYRLCNAARECHSEQQKQIETLKKAGSGSRDLKKTDWSSWRQLLTELIGADNVNMNRSSTLGLEAFMKKEKPLAT
jgi:hypothetical protein